MLFFTRYSIFDVVGSNCFGTSYCPLFSVHTFIQTYLYFYFDYAEFNVSICHQHIKVCFQVNVYKSRTYRCWFELWRRHFSAFQDQQNLCTTFPKFDGHARTLPFLVTIAVFLSWYAARMLHFHFYICENLYPVGVLRGKKRNFRNRINYL